MVGIALVFGAYYVWTGLQNFVRTGGQGVVEATERAVVVSTATAERRIQETGGQLATARPSFTPIPPCEEFVVVVANANVRIAPSTDAAVITAYNEGTVVCVKGRASAGSAWYLVDLRPETRLIEEAYMRDDVIVPVNPTPTPTSTFTPAPSVTPAPTLTPSPTSPPPPTMTPNPQATLTPPPTPMPTMTTAFQSA